MAVVEKSVLIEQSAETMFGLVDRVEDYPMFLPWCGGTELLKRDESVTAARIHINYRGIKAHFSTENEKEIPTVMRIRLTDGPFSQLDGAWRFTPLAESACKIHFRLHYEITHRILDKALGPVFNHIASTFVEAFVTRAGQVFKHG